MDILLSILEGLPWYGDLLFGMGVLRAIFKPIFSVVQIIVSSTKTKTDDEALAELQESKLWALLVWFIDYFSSIKLIPK